MTPGKVYERLKAKKNCVKKKNIFFSDMDYEYLRSVRCFNYFLIGGDFCRSLTKSSDNFLKKPFVNLYLSFCKRELRKNFTESRLGVPSLLLNISFINR